MVALLVALTILALLAADYFLLRRGRQAEDPEGVALPGPRPLSAAFAEPPAGVFLQPTFTWSRIRPDGELVVGVHPLLFGLVGAPYGIDLLPGGDHVGKGAPLARITKGGRTLTVRSPVDGRVTDVNRAIAGEAEWNGIKDGNGSWLYRIAPERVAPEILTWTIADRAAAWTAREYQRVRERLLELAGSADSVRTMMDGGEIPTGVLASLDDNGWAAFERMFLGQ